MEGLFPGGTEVPYTLTGSALAVELMGTTYEGTWDGAKLAIDGTEAAKQQ